MAKKWEKYIHYETPPNPSHPDAPLQMLLGAGGNLGSFYFNFGGWRTKPIPFNKTRLPHYHDYDEYVGIFGGDPYNQSDLGGEVEWWFEDEKYIITKSVMIYVPAGVLHTPEIFRKVDRPFFHFSVATGSPYIQKHPEKVPDWFYTIK